MSKEPKTCYCHDANGYYVGQDSDYGDALPNNSTYVPPKIVPGFVPRWDGEAWEQIEDHRGEKGYVSGQHTEIKEPGPLPEGWTTEYVDPRSLAEIRSAEIKARLNQIDTLTIRPLRAKLAGKATADDEAKLRELEDEAEALRAEMAGLQ